jgi:hypothetical protein
MHQWWRMTYRTASRSVLEIGAPGVRLLNGDQAPKLPPEKLKTVVAGDAANRSSLVTGLGIFGADILQCWQECAPCSFKRYPFSQCSLHAVALR